MNDKKSWQCGGCGKWKAPHVEECGCAQAANPFQPVLPAPVWPGPYDAPMPWHPPYHITSGGTTKPLAYYETVTLSDMPSCTTGTKQ